MFPKPHFSWSQFSCYDRNPEDYFMQYILGVKTPPTPQMLLGSLVHAIAESRDIYTADEVGNEVMKLGLTPNYASGILKAIGALPRPKIAEHCLKAPCPFKLSGSVEFIAYLDGYDDAALEIDEYKTGASWNQDRVDAHEQFTFYAMLVWMQTGKRPSHLRLHHINLPNGKVTTFETKRNVKQIREFMRDRLFPVMSLIDKQVFHKL